MMEEYEDLENIPDEMFSSINPETEETVLSEYEEYRRAHLDEGK